MTRRAVVALGWLLAVVGTALIPVTFGGRWLLVTSAILWCAAVTLAKAYQENVGYRTELDDL